MLKGELPLVPEMHMSLVDVRDVARAHILAMEKVLSYTKVSQPRSYTKLLPEIYLTLVDVHITSPTSW